MIANRFDHPTLLFQSPAVVLWFSIAASRVDNMPFESSSMQPVSFDPSLDGDDEGIIADNPALEPADSTNVEKAKNNSIFGNMDIFRDFFLAAFSDGYYNVREFG